MVTVPHPAELPAAIGAYTHTAALRDGRVSSSLLRLAFTDFPAIARAFAPMVREGRFAVCEMAIASFLQARVYDKPLVLLPVVMAARYQEPALLTRVAGVVAGPGGLVGKRVGVRAYSQTTGMWLRGILAESHGVAPDAVRWVTFEDAHVPEFRDPAWCERAPAGSDMLTMLKDGALDGAVFGMDTPTDAGLQPVFPATASDAFQARYGFVPVNHLVVVRADQSAARIVELVRMFRAAANGVAFPASREALRPAIELAIRFSTEQGLLPRPLTVADVWRGLPDEVA